MMKVAPTPLSGAIYGEAAAPNSAPLVSGAWQNIKRSIVEALGPSGFSLLARAREMTGKTDLNYTAQEIAELMVAIELGASPEQRRALAPLLETYTRL